MPSILITCIHTAFSFGFSSSPTQKRYSPGSHPFPFASSNAVVTLSLISLGGGGPGGAPAGRGFDVSALTNGSDFTPSTAALIVSNSSGEYPPPTMTALTSAPEVGLELSTKIGSEWGSDAYCHILGRWRRRGF